MGSSFRGITAAALVLAAPSLLLAAPAADKITSLPGERAMHAACFTGCPPLR
jgi:hypothetical protein